jgi:hypothetical protein
VEDIWPVGLQVGVVRGREDASDGNGIARLQLIHSMLRRGRLWKMTLFNFKAAKTAQALTLQSVNKVRLYLFIHQLSSKAAGLTRRSI